MARPANGWDLRAQGIFAFAHFVESRYYYGGQRTVYERMYGDGNVLFDKDDR